VGDDNVSSLAYLFGNSFYFFDKTEIEFSRQTNIAIIALGCVMTEIVKNYVRIEITNPGNKF